MFYLNNIRDHLKTYDVSVNECPDFVLSNPSGKSLSLILLLLLLLLSTSEHF